MGRWEIDPAKIVPELFSKYLSVILFKIVVTQDHLAHLVELCFSRKRTGVFMAGQYLTLLVFLHCPLKLLLRGMFFGDGPYGQSVHCPGEQAFTSWHPKFHSALNRPCL